MNYAHAIVIDKNGIKVEFVLVEYESIVPVHKRDEVHIKNYVLKDGESLIYDNISTALSMLKPCWTGTAWKETASPEEIEAAKPESESQIIKESVSDLEIAFAEYVIETEQRLTDLEEKNA